jgi:hypothetical protein
MRFLVFELFKIGIIYQSILSGIGLYAREIGRSIDTEEDIEDPDKPSWFRTSPLDIGHLERLLDKKFTPLVK